jgi:dodecin
MTPGQVAEIRESSTTSFEDAITTGIARTNGTLRNVRSLWMKEKRVQVDASSKREYYVHMWITFAAEEWTVAPR